MLNKYNAMLSDTGFVHLFTCIERNQGRDSLPGRHPSRFCRVGFGDVDYPSPLSSPSPPPRLHLPPRRSASRSPELCGGQGRSPSPPPPRFHVRSYWPVDRAAGTVPEMTEDTACWPAPDLLIYGGREREEPT